MLEGGLMGEGVVGEGAGLALAETGGVGKGARLLGEVLGEDGEGLVATGWG